MALDKSALRFQAKVMTVAQETFSASCEGKEAEPFLDRVYKDYVADGSPEDVVGWIKNRLSGEFRSVEQPPRWVEDEPAWPFLDGHPMVFVSQATLPENEVTKAHLTWGEVVYLFGARVSLQRGYRIEYRVVSQHPGADGTGQR